MTRRGLLAIAGAGLLGAAPGGFVDSHIHFYDPGRPQDVPWPSPDSDLYRACLPGPWSAMVRPLGITGAVVVEASPWLEDNQWVLDLAKDHPVILGLVGHLDVGIPEFRATLAGFRRNPLFLGIRLGEKPLREALSTPAALEDLRRLSDTGMMLDVVGNGPILLDVARLADRIPGLRIVVDHLPFAAPAGALEQLQGRTNVYAKVSGTISKRDGRMQLDELWRVFGADRVIYASNWPVCERVAPYAAVLKIVKGYADALGTLAAEKFFRLNSAACYRWSSRT